jgi:hypothetical protein
MFVEEGKSEREIALELSREEGCSRRSKMRRLRRLVISSRQATIDAWHSPISCRMHQVWWERMAAWVIEAVRASVSKVN